MKPSIAFQENRVAIRAVVALRIPANVTADSGDRDRWRCCAL
jgi:hypothetical protein